MVYESLPEYCPKIDPENDVDQTSTDEIEQEIEEKELLAEDDEGDSVFLPARPVIEPLWLRKVRD